jgi:L-fuculose-phosphate aldolase
VVHAHPPTATGFAVAGQGLPGNVLPEIALLMGEVPCVPYATSRTPALGDAVGPFLDRHVALLLANHGALTWGRTGLKPESEWKAWSMAPGSCWQPVLSAG